MFWFVPSLAGHNVLLDLLTGPLRIEPDRQHRTGLLEPRVGLRGEGEPEYRLEADPFVTDRFPLSLRRGTDVAK
jgi:hypothetical protein